MTHRARQSGFTLIETLLYISISAVLLLAVSGLVQTVLSSRVKSQTVADVEREGAMAMETMTQAIRNARGINAPGAGQSGATLSLVSVDPAKDPLVFNFNSDALRETEGSGSPVDLTSARVVVSDAGFENLTGGATPGAVRIHFTVSHVNTSGRNEYDYSRTFYGTASIR